jgi:hypothetical protein
VTALEFGYRLGYAAGVEVGYGQCVAKLDEAAREAAATVRRGPLTPALAELQRRRDEPGDAALAWRARFGREYRGGPVRW